MRRSAATLYDALIRPIQKQLRGFPTLWIVPDKLLVQSSVFSSFQPGNRPLSSRRPRLGHQPQPCAPGRGPGPPSCVPRAPRRSRPGSRANPAFDRTRLSNLPDLPGAEAEAEKIAKILPDSLLLTGKNATRKAFLDAANQYAIVHFGGHAIANEEYSLLSQLLFAPRSGDDGSLWAFQIYAQRWSKTRLVVLAACSPARARISPGQRPPEGLARPLLSPAYRPSWRASGKLTTPGAPKELFQSFYARLAQGRPLLDALREAQLEQIKHASKPEGRSPENGPPSK